MDSGGPHKASEPISFRLSYHDHGDQELISILLGLAGGERTAYIKRALKQYARVGDINVSVAQGLLNLARHLVENGMTPDAVTSVMDVDDEFLSELHAQISKPS